MSSTDTGSTATDIRKVRREFVDPDPAISGTYWDDRIRILSFLIYKAINFYQYYNINGHIRRSFHTTSTGTDFLK